MLFLFATASFGQITEREIKLSGQYKYGEAFDLVLDNARNYAIQNLMRGIRVRINTSMMMIEQEVNDEVYSEFTNMVEASSEMELMGIRFLEIERGDGSWKAIAYIKEADFERSIDEIRTRLYNKLDEALRLERRGEVSSAISLYYEVYLESFGVPLLIQTDPLRHGEEVDLNYFTRTKLYHWLGEVEVEISEIRNRSSGDNIELNLALNLSWNGRPAEEIDIGLSRPGYGYRRVIDGKAEIFYDLQPQNLIEMIDFDLRIAIPRTLPPERKDFAENKQIDALRRIPIDFSDHIRPDFSIEKLSDRRYRFTPETGPLLSVSTLNWDFGDGNRSNDLNPVHTYQNSVTNEVVALTINRSDKMVIRKRVNPGVSPQDWVNTQREITARQLDNYDTYTIPNRYKNELDRIASLRDELSLERYLLVLRRDGALSTLTTSPSRSEELRSYVIVYNRNSTDEFVRAILSPVRNGNRYDVLSTPMKVYPAENWRSEFTGMGPVWVEFR